MEQTQKRQFNAEVSKVLKLMIGSLYTNRDTPIRELISNASDACDKLRYLSQQDSSLLEGDGDFKIEVSIDKDAKHIIVKDNGIGMNEEDLIENLGTIAKSGTEGFLSQLSGDAKKDSQLIGQFGVGFYSVFMIADKATVITKKAKEDTAYIWESEGEGEYTISKYNDKKSRGTEIILHLKEDAEEYLDHFRVKHIIKTYSDHISVPIMFIDQTKNEVQVNSGSALWMKPKSSITPEQYKDFYKSVSYSADEPWMIIHNKNEGVVEFTNLLYIPTQKTFDLFHPDRKRRVKLYIKRIFITEENVELIPSYLRFLRGVIDSEDLPLNISRETLQHNAVLEKIKSIVTKKVLSELKKKKDEDRESYQKFWENFGGAIKEGLCEFNTDAESLLDLCLFKSILHNKMISLEEYIKSMQEGQKEIYYISSESENISSSPQVEGFISKGIDVLVFTDTVDDFWVNVVSKFKDYDIKSVTRSEIDLKDDKETTDEPSSDHSKLITEFKKVLGENVKDVKISKKLVSSPVCLAVSEGAMDIRMERFLVEQKQLRTTTSKILEVNPNHKIIQKIENGINSGENFDDLIQLLFEEACIIEGETVKDTSGFLKRLNQFLEKAIDA